jgi:TP901-1 family phage major tail protein
MAWNTNNDLINGDKLLLYLVSGTTANTKVVAYATSCSIQIDQETIDTSSKFSCKWNATLGGRCGYTISADALYCNATNAASNSGVSFDALMALMLEGEAVGWMVGQEQAFTGSCEDNPHTLDTSKPYYSGKAVITSLSLEAGNNEIASSSISMTGSGEITPHNAS